MANVVTQAARFVVLQPKAESTTSTGGSSEGVVAAVVVSRKGKPGIPLEVTGESWQTMLGKPLPMSDGSNAEGLRHLSDALAACGRGYVVRAIADDARYPSIIINTDGTVVKANHAFSTDLALGAGALMGFYVKDGDVDAERSFEVTNADTSLGTFDLTVSEKVSDEWAVIATYEDLSVDVDGVDDSGLNAFAETALESRSPYIGCIVSRDITKADIADVAVQEFEGGTTGGEVTAQNVIDAWTVLQYSNLPFNLGMAAGQYDHTAIRHMNDICDGLMIQFRFDAPPSMNEQEVEAWLVAINLGNSFAASAYHYPYKANDPYQGGKSAWGVSGEATAAKARCFATNSSRPDVPGVHYSAGGSTRGFISRSGIEPIHTTGFTSAESKVEIKDGSGKIVGRLNPVSMGKTIDDVLTCYAKKNYLKLEHVVSIYFAMSHEVQEGASALKFEPDGITEDNLNRLCQRIGQKFYDSGALVTPRKPEKDGTEPYIFKISQAEIDLWYIEMSICPTGVFRRGALQPIILQ